MQETVSMDAAAKELGLRPRELERAVQLGEVCAVPEGVQGSLGVPGAELERVKRADGFPHALRQRLRVVGTVQGAELLGIAPARFLRLARGGCFRPVEFYINRYRAVAWLYLAAELRVFAERRPELLRGNAPRGLRVLLDEGVDHRPWHWRDRRVGQLCRQAAGPWERAAARAAVLDEDVLACSVPDEGERARLRALRPDVAGPRTRSASTEQIVRRLCLATSGDEILWHRLMLDADLEEARAAEPAGSAGPLTLRSVPAALPASPCAVRSRSGHRLDPAVRGAVVASVRPGAPGRASYGAGRPPQPGQRRWRDRLRRRTTPGPAAV